MKSLQALKQEERDIADEIINQIGIEKSQITIKEDYLVWIYTARKKVRELQSEMKDRQRDINKIIRKRRNLQRLKKIVSKSIKTYHTKVRQYNKKNFGKVLKSFEDGGNNAKR